MKIIIVIVEIDVTGRVVGVQTTCRFFYGTHKAQEKSFGSLGDTAATVGASTLDNPISGGLLGYKWDKGSCTVRARKTT